MPIDMGGFAVPASQRTQSDMASMPSSALALQSLNPRDADGSLALSNGSMTVTKSGSNGHCFVRALTGMSSGKWYWEVRQDATMTNSREIAAITKGVVSPGTEPGASANGYGYNGINGLLYNSNVGAAFGSTFNTGDVIGIAFDASAGKLWFAKNNVWQASGNPATGASPAVTSMAAGTWFPSVGMFDVGGIATAKFFAASQTYAAPSGFSAFG